MRGNSSIRFVLTAVAAFSVASCGQGTACNPRPSGPALVVRVFEQSTGAPVCSATIVAVGPGARKIELLKNADCTYQVTDAFSPPGVWEVQTIATGYQPDTTSLTTAGADECGWHATHKLDVQQRRA